MLKQALTKYVSDRQKRTLKAKVNGARRRFVRAFLSYDAARLQGRLRAMGVTETDTLLVHSNFEPDSGFQGAPLDVANALADLVGQKGNLMMVSLPFRGTAYDYLNQNKVFNVRKTLSMMGLVTEMFRRRDGTLRSLHPTHPVLAFGKDAAWITADHDKCLYPCGPGTPFEKFRTLGGKILFFDVGFEAITFFHYVEHLLQNRLPFPVYDERLFSIAAVDASGHNHTVQTYTFNKAVPRRADKLAAEVSRQGKMRKGRVGNSSLILVTAEDVVSCQTAMVEAGNFPYDLPAERL
jgi:aminoglycoside 3-N-acetyltransferase